MSYMWNMFCTQANMAKEEAKTVILRTFFNSASQKKAVTQAARESAEDQKELVERYHKELQRK